MKELLKLVHSIGRGHGGGTLLLRLSLRSTARAELRFGRAGFCACSERPDKPDKPDKPFRPLGVALAFPYLLSQRPPANATPHATPAAANCLLV